MPVLVANGRNPNNSWLITDGFLVVILVALAAVLVYGVRRCIREYKQQKPISKKVLDIEACTHVEEDNTVHTKSNPEVYQVPSIPTTVYIPSWAKHSQRDNTTTYSTAPIHGHVTHIPISKDNCVASQKLKRSFSEGAYGISRCPSLPVHHVVTPLVSDARHQISDNMHLDVDTPKQPSSAVVPSGKLRLANAIEGRTATEDLVQDHRTSASSVQKQISGEFLDVKTRIATKEERNSHIIARSNSRPTASVPNFDNLAPIHDHLVHIPTPKDFCTTSQQLKRSFSEGIHDFSRYPCFSARRPLVATDTHKDQDANVVSPGDLRLNTVIEGSRLLMDGVIQKCLLSVSASSFEAPEEKSVEASEISKARTEHAVENETNDSFLDYYHHNAQ